MKKPTIFFTALLITCSACKRNTYTCYCSQGIGGVSYQKEETVYRGSKKKADTECLSKAGEGESCYPVFGG